MSSLLHRLLRIRPGEGRIILILGILLFANAFAIQVSNIVSVSGFLNTVGVDQMILVWIVANILVIITAGLQARIIDRYERVSLVRTIIFAFAMMFIILRLLFAFKAPNWLNYSLLFVLSDQQWLLFPVFFWVLANDVMEMAQAKRLFPVIAGFGLAGNIIGIAVAAISPSLLTQIGVASAEVLTINVLIYLLAYVIVGMLGKVKLHPTAPNKEDERNSWNEGVDFVKEILSFRYLALAIVAVVICDNIFEFHFLKVSDAAIPNAGDYQTFYSLYRLGLTLGAFIIQTLVTSRLITKMNLKNTFFIFPVMLLLGSVWMLGMPGLVSAVGAIFLMKLTRDTVNESARKSFQSLVPDERRGRVSVFMDSYLLGIATIVACLVLGVFVVLGRLGGIPNYYIGYLLVALAASIFAVWCIIKMRGVYDNSLLHWRLKRRKRTSTVLSKLDF